ncbi:hypothetical protein [Paenibacillus glacialis]|uniref:Uncharacterized protein n=1 Tax=Paenibacillus glacialis TaxID=494026 RepID=A0A168K271_9BACL|nr:hypothetical protein [Paenibacillus glacialis]OAB41429.1 hypothetical protein PGLA_16645 [Paenibacillus glacialis]
MTKLTKIDVSIDLGQPVQEITDIISLVINAHPGQQLSILQALDQHISDAMAALEKAQAEQIKDNIYGTVPTP